MRGGTVLKAGTVTKWERAPDRPAPMTAVLRHLVEQTARRYKLSATALLAGDRTHPYVWARWEVWHRAHQINPAIYSYWGLGQRFGYDHTTVRHGILQYRAGNRPLRAGRPAKEAA